jgi:hypothetical protein
LDSIKNNYITITAYETPIKRACVSLIRQHAQKELSIFLKKRTMISLWMKKDLSISVHPDMSIKIDQPSQAVLL